MATRGRSETSPPRPLTETSRGSMPVPGRERAGPVTSALHRGPGAMVKTPGEYRQSRPPPPSIPWAIQRASLPPPLPYHPTMALTTVPRLDLNRLTLHGFRYLQPPLRRYVISVLSSDSIRCFLLSWSRLALDSVSHPDPCSSCPPPAKPYGPASAWPWLSPGVDPSSAFPVPCPPHRPVPGCSWPSC